MTLIYEETITPSIKHSKELDNANTIEDIIELRSKIVIVSDGAMGIGFAIPR